MSESRISADIQAYNMVASERHQRKVRLFVSLACLVAINTINFISPIKVASQGALQAFYIVAVSSILVLVYQIWSAHRRGAEDIYSERRVLVGQIFDAAGASLGFYCFGPNAIYIYPILLMIVLGNGMRFGLRPLATATILTVVGMSLAFFLSDYWRSQYNLIFCFLLGQLSVSIYFAVLVKRINMARDLIVQNEKGQVEMLKEMNDFKSRVFANISHEFRTPITLTLGSLELMQKHSYDREFLEKQAGVIRRSQDRLLRLVNQVLDLDKMEKGKFALRVQPILGFNVFLRNRVEQFQTIAEKKGLRLLIDVDPQLDLEPVYGDPENLDKVIFNLLSNAFKFTFSGEVYVQLAVENSEIHLTVKDSGIGIRDDQVERVFERFHQASDVNSNDATGTGIGLALVKEIVELHGGKVGVSSEYGRGTTFSVLLRRGPGVFNVDQIGELPYREKDIQKNVKAEGTVDIEGIEIHRRHNRLMQLSQSPHKRKVLYVDDNFDLREFIRDSIGKEFNVFFAVDGEDGYEVAQSVRPDLIVSDLMMPKLDGVGFLKKVRSDQRIQNIPFVMLTARANQEAANSAWKAGADDVFFKPFTRTQLVDRIRLFLKDGRVSHPSALRSM